MIEKAKVWEEIVTIPTYGAGQPEKNPMFLENRVYQGSSGVVYPYPVIEKIEDTCEDRKYNAVFLENEYIKVMILPELGGRVQMAYDKIKQRHFVYYNSVIKPALVGLVGPWISGGIEFNWPQHHRPSTFMPVDFSTEVLEDGSAVVWIGERERMFHEKSSAAFVLRPGSAVLEIRGMFYNPTPVPQTFLWWANPAVSVNDDYQSVFPDDVHAVFDHGKRDVSRYPIATGKYYKMDYSAGVDISRYKNIPVPTSYMAVGSKYDFVGGYENDTKGGLLHVSDHHLSPGKKQWTWGCGDFGKAWDRNLTDNDGPYIELMTGVFTDNQPDFSWLQPYEEKTFVQYFMPYREIGVVKNASKDLIMNLVEDGNNGFVLKVLATSRQENVKIQVLKDGFSIYDDVRTLSPEAVYEERIPISSYEGVTVLVDSPVCDEPLKWTYAPEEITTIPDPAKAAKAPAELDTAEKLFLTGLHLEQYRHATYRPEDYYLEALKRFPEDSRCNNAMGLLCIRRGRFAEAEKYLRRAIMTLTERNPNPYDSEPYYNLGLALRYMGRNEEAYDSFFKSCWSAAWQDAGYFQLAQISAAAGRWREALSHIDKSLARNWHNHRGRHLRAAILRNLGRQEEAVSFIKESLGFDRFNFGCLFESWLLTGAGEDRLIRIMRSDSNNYEDLALDYIRAGMWEDALKVISLARRAVPGFSPMLAYFEAWSLHTLGRVDEAVAVVSHAETAGYGVYFSNRLEDILALEDVLSLPCNSSRANYYLGNIWYDKRQYDLAVSCWEKSVAIDPEFPTAYRNLALAYYNKRNDAARAVECLEKAFALDNTDARVLMELDQLYRQLNRPHQERLDFLEKYMALVEKRDDLYLSHLTLLNQLGRYEDAAARIAARKFHPWEGGEGKVTEQYQIAHLEMGKALLAEGRLEEALKMVDACFVYPENLGEGKLIIAEENDFNYYRALVLEAMGKDEESAEAFAKASTGDSTPAAAIYYNDQKPDKIFYQGLALRHSGRENEARSRFNSLVEYGEAHIYDKFKKDYFAVSLPDLQIWECDMDKKNTVHCNYLMGLGYLGLGQKENAEKYFLRAWELDNNHQGVQMHKDIKL
ncbi:MAG: DUF5107 domain-containing protein [Candidatus Cryptobacteroides sp.]